MYQWALVDTNRESQIIEIKDLAAILGGIRTVDLVSAAIGERPLTSYNMADLSVRIANKINATYIEIINDGEVIGWCVDDDLIEKLEPMLSIRYTK